MIDANAIANLQMLMNTGDGRHAVLAEVLNSTATMAGLATTTQYDDTMPFCPPGIKIRGQQGKKPHLIQHARAVLKGHAGLPEDLITRLDKLPSHARAPLHTFAEGLAYHYNNLFMAVIGHISIVMTQIEPEHRAYSRFRECEELILNTATLIRILVDVFHRDRNRHDMLYPIDLSDQEIGQRLFPVDASADHGGATSQSKNDIHYILETLAKNISCRLLETFEALNSGIQAGFSTDDLHQSHGEHYRQVARYLKRGKRIAGYLLKFSGEINLKRQTVDLVSIAKDAANVYQSGF